MEMDKTKAKPSTAVYVFLVVSGFVALASGQLVLGFGFTALIWGVTYLVDMVEYHLIKKGEE